MSETAANHRNGKLRRVIVSSVSLLAVLVAGGLVLGVVERVRDAADRVH